MNLSRPISMVEQIDRCAGHQGMSDDQLANEHRAQRRLWDAAGHMLAAINAVNSDSAVQSINPDAFLDFIHDWLPTEVSWEEKIIEARRV